jgi:hypothetical protein
LSSDPYKRIQASESIDQQIQKRGSRKEDPEKRIQIIGFRSVIERLGSRAVDSHLQIPTSGSRPEDADHWILDHRIQTSGFRSADASGSRLSGSRQVIQTSEATPAALDQRIQPQLTQPSGFRIHAILRVTMRVRRERVSQRKLDRIG